MALYTETILQCELNLDLNCAFGRREDSGGKQKKMEGVRREEE